MKNDLLSQLTVQDIREIVTAFFDEQYDTYQFLADMDDKEASELWEYIQSDNFYGNVLIRMKDTNHYKPPCKERYPVLLEIAEEVTGHKLVLGSRKDEDVFIKCILAHKLHEEGYFHSEIGRMMKMSHSMMIHYVRRVNDMLSVPEAYSKEVKQYEQFKELADTI